MLVYVGCLVVHSDSFVSIFFEDLLTVNKDLSDLS